MGSGGRPIYLLEQIAERYKIMLHGVSLSVGSTDPVDFEYLKLLKNLIGLVKAQWVSDHLCWTGILGRNTHDLLPMPLTEESLEHVSRRVKIIQDFLEVPLVLENPSTYLEWAQDQMSEWDYLNALTASADCGLLLDVNNVYVSSYNHGFSAPEYIQKIAGDRVVYHHLSGHTNTGADLVDTHDDYVIDEVWALYTQCFQRLGGRSTMVEWDADIPAFEVVAKRRKIVNVLPIQMWQKQQSPQKASQVKPGIAKQTQIGQHRKKDQQNPVVLAVQQGRHNDRPAYRRC
jgi:uncharacterized protein (UPF0276 family)